MEGAGAVPRAAPPVAGAAEGAGAAAVPREAPRAAGRGRAVPSPPRAMVRRARTQRSPANTVATRICSATPSPFARTATGKRRPRPPMVSARRRLPARRVARARTRRFLWARAAPATRTALIPRDAAPARHPWVARCSCSMPARAGCARPPRPGVPSRARRRGRRAAWRERRATTERARSPVERRWRARMGNGRWRSRRVRRSPDRIDRRTPGGVSGACAVGRRGASGLGTQPRLTFSIISPRSIDVTLEA